ncbi:hypothetical protein [Tautonia sociabilis]|uniref:Uncharacterized protein n=1 Tax=Tautonia sociabilis TaxID=2080755 RepID=A0A432ML51_9BACT|nr:hypothetical protein [Tautonia sociabilis]RUL87989.1 hypothetical protein TsocGM_09715 [Tautonia sociabilis]
MAASVLVIRRLFQDLEIDWGKLKGPEIDRQQAKCDSGRAGEPGRGLPRPTLRHVLPEDLRDTGRLLDLYAEAVRSGLVRDSEHARLEFVASAEHALVAGTRNPCGLFVRMIRSGGGRFVTLRDEDAARARIHRYLYRGDRGDGMRLK